MYNKRLTLNVLNFHHSSEPICCYLQPNPVEGAVKLSEKDLPFIIRQLGLPNDTGELYTTFGQANADSIAASFYAVPDDSAGHRPLWSFSFLRKYYTNRLLDYFHGQGFPVKINFVGDLEVWVPDKSPYAGFAGYRGFVLRVQFGRITDLPELLIAPGDIHSVCNKPLDADEMMEISPDHFTRVLFDNRLYPYDKMPEEARRNPDRVFACLNPALQRVFRLQRPAPERGNRYISKWKEIESFRKRFFLREEFGRVLQLAGTDWITTHALRLEEQVDADRALLFGQDNVHTDPFEGMRTYGPKELTPARKVIFFFICHVNDKSMALTVHEYLKGIRPGFGGITRFAKIPYYTEQGLSIYFENKSDPMSEILEQLNNRVFSPDDNYVALYLSPFSKYGEIEAHKAIYYRVKEELLHRNIISQAIEVDKTWGTQRIQKDNKAVFESNFHYSLPNIAIAMLAKLGGTPWSLRPTALNELVIGIGAFRCFSQGKNYLGSAFSFSGEGRFYGFDYFRSDQTAELAGSILLAVRRYISEQKSLKRLIIHFYKNMSWRELAPIERGLEGLGLNIPVYVVSINKTLSDDVIGFNLNQDHKMPYSGSWFGIGNDQYLFYNSSLVEGHPFQSRDGYPLPLKVSIKYCPSSSGEIPASEQMAIPDLLRQVSLFSRLYWKSVSKQSLPVTLLYPEMLAEIAPHFTRPELPKTGKETLWFL